MNISTEFCDNQLIISLPETNNNFVLLKHQLKPNFRPYIHPLVSMDFETVLTQDSPEHHPWQHGLYFGMHHVNDTDFWLDEGMRENIGSFRNTQLIDHTVQNNQALWNIETTWVHHNGEELFKDRQTWQLDFENENYSLRVTWQLTALTEIKISQHAYGGIFLRMPWEKEMESTALNSQQQENKNAEQQRAKWVDVSLALKMNEKKWGITLLDDPSNEGYPSYWRVDGNYGIGPSPVIPNEVHFNKGESKKFTYHILPHIGPANIERINQKLNSLQSEGVLNG